MNTRDRKLVILGASCPEIEHIERRLQPILMKYYEDMGEIANEVAMYTLYGISDLGVRLTSGEREFVGITDGINTSTDWLQDMHMNWGEVLCVKCRPSAIVEFNNGTMDELLVFEHSDYGPASYWKGSAIGQLWEFLNIEATREDRLTAAGAHCLHHAYAGKCLKVEPMELLEFRLRQRADFRNEDVNTLFKRVNELMTVVKKTPVFKVNDEYVHVVDNYELITDAAAYGGYPCVYYLNSGKVCLICAAPNTVREFAKMPGLICEYAFPNRGIAAGRLVPGYTFDELVGKR